MKLFLTALLTFAFAFASSMLALPRTAQACQASVHDAFARADLVVVGELLTVRLEPPMKHMEIEVRRYLEGSGPSHLEIAEHASDMCESGLSSDNLGGIWIFGIKREPRGDLVMPFPALATLEHEGDVAVMLRQLGVTPPDGSGIEEAPASEAVRPAHMLGLFVVLAAAGAVRFVTRS